MLDPQPPTLLKNLDVFYEQSLKEKDKDTLK